MSKTEFLIKTYDGFTSAVIEKFSFFFENVVMHGTIAEKNADDLLSHLGGKAFDFYSIKFFDNGEINASASNFAVVNNYIIEK